ncbi:AcrR family transcriptional regulator [Aurantimicrobium minutum]|uniref:TetR/AcrR family transcriptional regulator n=1 Tax=Aurantimicrobium minutum TaxID=708131 RepID=UPI002406D35C|nr:TetR/AcrR family transcriptional regulator [Aurantimicrobium minutum]MDF9809867.1 AcrR family transcriptional regulator [Aurantimicrobium minutum]
MVKPKQTRAEGVLRNDNAISDALVAVIANEGWDSITISGVAKTAGVSVGAIYARAETISELANSVWQSTLQEVIRNYFHVISEAVRSGDPNQIFEVSRAHEKILTELKVGFELIIASVFDEELSEVIGADFSEILKSSLGFGGIGSRSEHQKAALFLVTSFILGRVLATISGSDLVALSNEEARTLAGFYGAPEEQHTSLSLPVVHFVRHSEDNELVLEKATLNAIAQWGYRKSTFARIARKSGTSPGALISGHTSKVDLVAYSARELLYSPKQVWQPFDGLIEQYGSPEVRTEFLESYLAPHNRENWKLNIELARVSGIYPELAQFKTPADPLQRTHLALMLLAIFLPDVHSLPFQGCFRMGITT